MTGCGDEHYAQAGPRQFFRHAADQAPLDDLEVCTRWGHTVAVEDTLVTPGPGLAPATEDDDLVTRALVRPHPLLQPVRA